HSYEAYLVGGCVRDLLLGGHPKDFDVATSAHPEEIRGVFRNCRLIGRRFRLAHIYFRGKVIEVSTFRAHPTEIEDLNDSADEPTPETEAAVEDAEEMAEPSAEMARENGTPGHSPVASPASDSPEQQSGDDVFITHDNVFGTAEQDARRRDFTINGLFYDV